MKRSPSLYICILLVWMLLLLLTFRPLLVAVEKAEVHGWLIGSLVATSTVLVACFWLNGTKDIVYPIYSRLFRKSMTYIPPKAAWPRRYGVQSRPSVAMVYCTYNDFNPESLYASMQQDYSWCKTVILDDSTKPEYMLQIDAFAAQHNLQVVRRKDRVGFKAGNLNNYLHTADYDYFVILDSDEIIPRNFVTRALDYFADDKTVGVVQATHIATRNRNRFMRLFAPGVDSFWPIYLPLKQRCGFLSLMGHGAMVSKDCYIAAGGFPHVVAEDLCFSIEAWCNGYRVTFAADIVCEEEYPVNYLAFKKRHSKWTQGNMEFIKQYTWRILSAPMAWFEKLDIILSTYNLPLTAIFALYITINVVVLPLLKYYFVYPSWLIIPTVAFLLAPMLNDILFYRRSLSIPRLIWYLAHSSFLYGSMLFISLTSSLKSLFGSSVFLVTPKDQTQVSWREALRANIGEVTFSASLIAISLLFDKSPLPVVLIVVPSIMSVYLSVFANKPTSGSVRSKSKPIASPTSMEIEDVKAAA